MLRTKKGFTLIEIIVVVVIIAVLMAVAVPSVMSYISEGNNAKYESVARAALINTQTAVAKDYMTKGKLDTTNNCNNAVIWIENYSSDTIKEPQKKELQETFGNPKPYGDNVKLWVTNITLNSSGDNIKFVSYCISLNKGGKYKDVSVTVNGNVTVNKDYHQGDIKPATHYTIS